MQFDKHIWGHILTLNDSIAQETEILNSCFATLLKLIHMEIKIKIISSQLLFPCLQDDASKSFLTEIIDYFTEHTLIPDLNLHHDKEKIAVKMKLTNLIYSIYSHLN